MAKLTSQAFVKYLILSRLVADDELNPALDKIRQERGGELPGNAELVAVLLIEAGLITRWHADKLFDKKYKGFYLGKYKLLSHLGTGEMSSVYLAEHVVMHQLRAIKVLPKAQILRTDLSTLHLFHLEAQAAASLAHPNLVRAFEVDNDGDQHFFVMEYVDGQTLQALVAELGPLPLDVACNLICQAAEGLDHAHQHGVIHCDIKPANLMLDKQGVVRILDLGLALHAKAWRESLAATHADQILATANYLSPEQALNSHQVDLRTDIYCLGCTLYFLLTGHPPFPAGSFVQKIALHMQMMPVNISQDRPNCPDDLADICRKMLQKNPDLRYQTMREVVQALESWLIDHGYDDDPRRLQLRVSFEGSRCGMRITKTDYPEVPLPAQPRISSGKLMLGCLGVTLLVLVAAVAVPWLVSNQQAAARVAAAVKRVQARGEPLTTAGLNDFYQPVKGRPDMTRELMAALAICDRSQSSPNAKLLPIVGEGAVPPPRGQSWTQLAEAETYLAPQQEAIKTFHEFARRDGTARFPVDFTPGVATLLPETQKMRGGARALSLQFQVHLHKDEISQAVDCTVAQIALSCALDQEPSLVSQLVHLAIYGMGIDQVQTLVRQAEISDEDLRRLETELRKLDFQGSLKAGLVGERTINYTACLDPQQLAEVQNDRLTREVARRSPKRLFDTAKMLEMNLDITEGADQSLFAARKAALKVDDEMRDIAASPLGKFYYLFTLLTSPAYSQAVSAVSRVAASRDSADVAIAAELYRRQNGKWPAKLDDLVPKFLPTVPTDPFTNLPLCMKASPESFKAYSTGLDGIDNGGILTSDQKPGTDIGFEMPVGKEKP